MNTPFDGLARAVSDPRYWYHTSNAAGKQVISSEFLRKLYKTLIFLS